MRGYPFLRGFSNVQMQSPGMQYTGSIAKKVLSLILELVNTNTNKVGRAAIHKLTLRSSTADMYFRHWREMVAAAIVCPAVFGGAPVEKCWRLLLRLTQLLNAAWRSAEGDKDATARESAAATTELPADLMAPLYDVLKPLDPRTADSGVHTLYFHAAVAHLRGQLGDNRSAATHLVDDNVEAHLRASSRYVNARANNAHRVQIFTDMAALSPATLKSGFKGRTHPSGLLLTTNITYCPCVTELTDNKGVEYDAALSIARDDALFSVSAVQGGHYSSDFPLGDVLRKNGRRAGGKPAKVARMTSCNSPKELLRRGLREQQGTITMCVCGALTGEMRSKMAEIAGKAFLRRKLADAAKKAKKDAALCRAEQHVANKSERPTRGGRKSTGWGERGGRDVRRKTQVHETARGSVTGAGRPVAATPGGRGSGRSMAVAVEAAMVNTRNVGAEAEAAGISVAGGGAANGVTYADNCAATLTDVFNEVVSDTDGRPDDGFVTQSDCHLMWLSQLCAYMPPDDVAALVFSFTGDTSRTRGAIPRNVEAKLLDPIAMTQLLRLRLCTHPFALWLVKSKTDAGDVRKAIDRILNGLHLALEAVSEEGDGA